MLYIHLTPYTLLLFNDYEIGISLFLHFPNAKEGFSILWSAKLVATILSLQILALLSPHPHLFGFVNCWPFFFLKRFTV